ncbi:MAG: tetratricopeptide repeat protein [Deltaproteobacteria bacterium]|nr:tetratricopeptide repeat protein [Deltaproteobacteria bacterium]
MFEKTLAAHPDAAAFHEIHGLDLELSGAPAEAARAAYERALALDPRNARALAALGLLVLHDDPESALVFFDRAIATDSSDAAPKLQAARALIATGRSSQAAERLNALLLEHPSDAEAASLSAELDLEQGIATQRTLDRAHRGVRFGGGADAFDLLSRVHAQRDEPELAERAAERARVLREASR